MNYKEILNNILEESNLEDYFSLGTFDHADNWPDIIWEDYFNSTTYGTCLRAAVEDQMINEIYDDLPQVLCYILILIALDRINAATMLGDNLAKLLDIDKEVLREFLKKLFAKYATIIDDQFKKYQEEN